MVWADFTGSIWFGLFIWAFLIALVLRGFTKLVGSDNAKSIGGELFRRWFLKR